MTRRNKHEYFGGTSKPTGPLEDDELTRVGNLYAGVGCTVYSTRQYRASRQALGLPDFYVMHARIGGWWHEGKRRGGVHREKQVAFMERCRECKVPYVLGGVAEAEAFLVRWKLIVSLPNGVALAPPLSTP